MYSRKILLDAQVYRTTVVFIGNLFNIVLKLVHFKLQRPSWEVIYYTLRT